MASRPSFRRIRPPCITASYSLYHCIRIFWPCSTIMETVALDLVALWRMTATILISVPILLAAPCGVALVLLASVLTKAKRGVLQRSWPPCLSYSKWSPNCWCPAERTTRKKTRRITNIRRCVPSNNKIAACFQCWRRNSPSLNWVGVKDCSRKPRPEVKQFVVVEITFA